MVQDTIDRPEYSGPDWGIIAGIALLGLGFTIAGTLSVMFGTETLQEAPGVLVWGVLLFNASGILSIGTSRTMAGIVRAVDDTVHRVVGHD